MEKTKLLKLIKDAKTVYDSLMLNKNFIYVYQNCLYNNRIDYIEAKCLSSNFLHLTGIKTQLKGHSFYKKLEQGRIALNDINEGPSGWTQLKLENFDKLKLLFNSPIQICLQDNMYTVAFQADVMLNRPNIEREDIILGLKKNSHEYYYAPSSIIKRAPNQIGSHFSRVICILSKNINETHYSSVTYKAKEIDILKIIPNEIKNKIDIKY